PSRFPPSSNSENHNQPIMQQAPCGRSWPSEARSDEGCSRERQRLTPLEHPSTVSALRADPPSPTRGEGRMPAQKFHLRFTR
ncbi:MAG: hypothetical protein EOQ32_32050, partial [Mesorhizobium sp.]